LVASKRPAVHKIFHLFRFRNEDGN
jgi:hypothetical protein